jgi:hypothetical protein
MTANEIRIGNYHYYHIVDPLDERGEYDDVCQIDPDDFRILTQFDCPEYKPIPLTEEWLLKFDWFSVDEGKYTFRDIEYYSISEDGSLYFMNQYTATDIKYVHQLQNLYFALTGNELTINK